jgi:hypothetical protein
MTFRVPQTQPDIMYGGKAVYMFAFEHVLNSCVLLTVTFSVSSVVPDATIDYQGTILWTKRDHLANRLFCRFFRIMA